MRLVADNPVFDTLQGEGVLTGTPSTFVRLAGCDLRCNRKDNRGWSCDTPRSLPDYDNRRLVWRSTTRFAKDIAIGDVEAMVMRSNPTHVVITGGEPMLQHREVAVLLTMLRHRADLVDRPLHATLETNSRHFSSSVARKIELVSLSPKVYQPDSIDFNTIEAWCGTRCDLQVKIVLAELDPEAVRVTQSVFNTVRRLREDAVLFVQRADVAGVALWEHRVVADWVASDAELRALGVRYGLQAHKVIGVQ